MLVSHVKTNFKAVFVNRNKFIRVLTLSYEVHLLEHIKITGLHSQDTVSLVPFRKVKYNGFKAHIQQQILQSTVCPYT